MASCTFSLLQTANYLVYYSLYYNSAVFKIQKKSNKFILKVVCFDMAKDQNYTDLLYQEITKALHDEEIIESALPILYQKATSEISKSIIKKLMDANKRHQDLLDTTALSIVAHKHPVEYKNSAIATFLPTIDNLKTSEHIQWGFFVIPTLQKVVHQQLASFEILASLTKHAGFTHLSEDFHHLIDETSQICEELQKTWLAHLQ